MMPDSDIVFLDEVFKANSAILNATLKAINERKFNLGDQIIDVPLHSLFAASNELPQSGELDALFDRLHFKHFASNIQETTNFVKLLSMNDSSAIKPTLSLDIINQAHIAASKVEVGDEVLEAFVNLKEQLSEENIVISDRRWRECVRIVRSEAFYNGHEVAEVEDMRPLMHALWTDTDQIKIVRRLVLDLANPLEREASELLDELSVAYEQFEVALRDADNKQQRAAHAVEMYKKLEKAKNRYKDLRKRNQGKDSDVFDDLGTKIQTVGKSLLKGLGHDDEEDIDE
jgi:MoxR-like ATPase